MAKSNFLNYVVLAVVGLATVPALCMDDNAAKEEIEKTHERIMDQSHASYLGLSQEQRNKLRDDLNSSEGTPQDKLKSHNSLLEKMHAENTAKEGEKAANEEIEKTHERIMDPTHASYLGLSQEQRNKLREDLHSSEGTPQDKLKSHNSLLEKMHAENTAKEMKSREQEENLLKESEQFMNKHLNDQEIYKRTSIVQNHAEYLWLNLEQKQELFDILKYVDSHDSQSREKTFKKFDDLLKEMESKNSQK